MKLSKNIAVGDKIYQLVSTWQPTRDEELPCSVRRTWREEQSRLLLTCLKMPSVMEERRMLRTVLSYWNWVGTRSTASPVPFVIMRAGANVPMPQQEVVPVQLDADEFAEGGHRHGGADERWQGPDELGTVRRSSRRDKRIKLWNKFKYYGLAWRNYPTSSWLESKLYKQQPCCQISCSM